MSIQFEAGPISRFLFRDTRMAWFWLIVRVFVGYQWIEAGISKIVGGGWVGTNSGQALAGFVNGAIAKTSGAHPDVQVWYGSFLQFAVSSHPALWAHMIAYGEVLVGIALILGLFTGIAAFFGFFMNFNFLMAGAISINPILIVLQIALMLAWKTAGYLGLDRYALVFTRNKERIINL